MVSIWKGSMSLMIWIESALLLISSPQSEHLRRRRKKRIRNLLGHLKFLLLWSSISLRTSLVATTISNLMRQLTTGRSLLHFIIDKWIPRKLLPSYDCSRTQEEFNYMHMISAPQVANTEQVQSKFFFLRVLNRRKMEIKICLNKLSSLSNLLLNNCKR